MKTLLPFLFLFFFMISCQKNDEEILEKTNVVDVYVAGAENNKASLWKNNLQQYLASGDGITATELNVDNNNVYVAGFSQFSNNLNYYWKNNIRFEIRQSLNIPANLYLQIKTFTVRNNDIYFTGITENPSPSNPNEKYQHCYWKNGIKNVLNTTANYYEDLGIGTVCLYNSKVYTTGNKTINNILYAGYYEETVFHPLITILDTNNDRVANLTSNNTNLYISGQKNGQAFYKNLTTGVETQLNQTSPLLRFPDITLDGNDVYTIQSQGYYKNNNSFTPFSTQDPVYGRCYEMIVYQQNVYTLRIWDAGYTGGKVFINDVQTLFIPSAQPGIKQVLTSLFVVPH